MSGPKPKRDSGRCPVAIVTSYSGDHAALIPHALPSMAAHAERYGFDLILAPMLRSGPIHFDHSKIAALRQALASHQAAIWIDGDSLIRADAPPIALILDEPLALGWDRVHHGYCSQLMGARRDALDQLDAVWQARSAWPLDDHSGVLRSVLGEPGDGMHLLYFNGQVSPQPQRSLRLGDLGVIHVGTGHNGIDGAIDRLTQARRST